LGASRQREIAIGLRPGDFHGRDPTAVGGIEFRPTHNFRTRLDRDPVTLRFWNLKNRSFRNECLDALERDDVRLTDEILWTIHHGRIFTLAWLHLFQRVRPASFVQGRHQLFVSRGIPHDRCFGNPFGADCDEDGKGEPFLKWGYFHGFRRF